MRPRTLGPLYEGMIGWVDTARTVHHLCAHNAKHTPGTGKRVAEGQCT